MNILKEQTGLMLIEITELRQKAILFRLILGILLFIVYGLFDVLGFNYFSLIFLGFFLYLLPFSISGGTIELTKDKIIEVSRDGYKKIIKEIDLADFDGLIIKHQSSFGEGGICFQYIELLNSKKKINNIEFLSLRDYFTVEKRTDYVDFDKVIDLLTEDGYREILLDDG